MNKFKTYFALISAGLLLFSSCGPDDIEVVPLRDYQEQYNTENAMIEDYLKTYYIESVVDHPGYTDDQDVILSKIPTGNTTLTPIWDDPRLESKEVVSNNVTYKLYYLKLRQGDIDDGVTPTKVDKVFASYNGKYLRYTTTTVGGVSSTSLDQVSFETVVYPQAWLGLDETIKGWAEIFPLFNSGTYDHTPSPNPAIFYNFGSGVMFVPSGLAYYASGSYSIPGYSPLIFSFKLYDVKRADQDGDGVLSIDEDLNHDGVYDEDTDGDGTYNINDADDDGDGILTKNEIQKNPDGSLIDTDGDGIPNYLDKDN